MIRVLLVEDDPCVATASKAVLEHLGYLVMMANDGRQGLELIIAAQPDIVVTDVMMPVMSGLEMIERARAVPYEGPIVVCSAVPEHEYRNHPVRYDAFLQKPYRMKDMETILANLQDRLHRKSGCTGLNSSLLPCPDNPL